MPPSSCISSRGAYELSESAASKSRTLRSSTPSGNRRSSCLRVFDPTLGYHRRMDSGDDERILRYQHLEPPIPLDQMIESVDVADHPDGQDEGYRYQEWLIRNAPG